MGKGSRQRSFDVDKFNEQFDKIFPRKKTPSHGKTKVHKDKKKEAKKRGWDES